MAADLEKGFTLGACEIRPGEQCIVNNGKSQHVEPKSMAVLLELAANGQDLVPRDELISKVWPRGYVTDDVLNRCISQLRSALGDDPKAPAYIATIPRKGYRLVAEVKKERQAEVEGILVLPFQNLAAHGMDEYLADGLTELLIARLAVGLDQRVISRTTAMAYKGSDIEIPKIRKKLSVKWVVEGSLLQLGNQVQIVVQLIDAETDAHSWAETWTRPSGDIMSVLNEVSRQVSSQINQTISDPLARVVEEQALPEELLRRYLQGMHHASRRTVPSLEKAMVCFKDVLDEHAEHAPALSGMALCHVLLVHYGAQPADEGMPVAREFCERALRTDPESADALGNLAAVHFFHDWDFVKAGMLIERALSIKPSMELGMMLAANVNLVLGRYEKSQSLVDRALSVDPLNVGMLMNAGDILILQRRYGEAIANLEQALELAPQMRPARLRLALAQAMHGQAEQARTTLNQVLEPGAEDASFYEYQAIIAHYSDNADLAADSAASLQALADQDEGVLPWSLARAWAAAGDSDKAIACLEQAFESRSTSMPFLGRTPMLDSVRHRPEMTDLMKRAGLPV